MSTIVTGRTPSSRERWWAQAGSTPSVTTATTTPGAPTNTIAVIAVAGTVRIASGGNAGDTAAGVGVREVTITGETTAGLLVTETLATAGASASASTVASFARIYRFFASVVGANNDAEGTITLQTTAGVTIGTIAAGATASTLTSQNRYVFLGAADTVRVRAGGNAADTAAGAGARSITIYGLDANRLPVSETLATAGASASLATTQTFLRVNYVELDRPCTALVTVEATTSRVALQEVYAAGRRSCNAVLSIRSDRIFISEAAASSTGQLTGGGGTMLLVVNGVEEQRRDFLAANGQTFRPFVAPPNSDIEIANFAITTATQGYGVVSGVET